MKKQFIKDLQEGVPVKSQFLLGNLQQRKKNNGDPFLTFTLSDCTGSLNANMWDNFDHLSLQQVHFVLIEGIVKSYNNKMQINVSLIQNISEDLVDIKNFLPCTPKNIEEMFLYIKEKSCQIKNPTLNNLLKEVFSDTKLISLLKTAPAAKSMHNAYIGGLLEHIYSLLQLADFVTEYYDNIDKDLLVTGIIFHDLGKIFELNYQYNFEYTDDGKLLGHNIISIEVLEKYASKLSVPLSRELLVALKHMILSHHGRLEWGAAKIPVTLEALVLHHLDNLDAKICGFQQFLEQDKSTSSKWTSKNFFFENLELFKKY